MSVMNDIKGGADLTHPKMSGGWIIGASVAVAILMIAFAIGSYLFKAGKTVVGGTTSKINAGVSDGISGVFGDGT